MKKRAAIGVALMAVAGFLAVLAIGRLTREPTIAPAVLEPPAVTAAPAADPQTPPSTPPPGPPVERALTKVPAVGRATAYVPARASTRVVLFISGEGGFTAEDTERAKRAGAGSVAVLLSFDSLKKAQGAVRCWFPAGVLEEIAKSVEGQLDLPEYHEPALVGSGAGASLAYASFAQAPAGTFAGAIGLGFSPALPTNRPLCATHDWKPSFDDAKHRAQLPEVPNPLFDWQDLGVAGSGDARLDESLDALFARHERPSARTAPPTASAAELERRLDALKFSLDDTWAEHPKASLIFMSGDGGWRDIDQHLAAYLAPRGVNVIGWSSAVYLWKAKTPPQGGADLRKMADIVADAQVPLFVGGYSLGAEVMPFFLDAWPEADRKRISGQVLIAPSATASFEWTFSALDWMPFHKEKVTAYRVADAVRHAAVPVFCMTGTQVAAANTACAGVADIATVVKLPGDHHFNGAYDAIGKAALDFIEKHLTRSP